MLNKTITELLLRPRVTVLILPALLASTVVGMYAGAYSMRAVSPQVTPSQIVEKPFNRKYMHSNGMGTPNYEPYANYLAVKKVIGTVSEGLADGSLSRDEMARTSTTKNDFWMGNEEIGLVKIVDDDPCFEPFNKTLVEARTISEEQYQIASSAEITGRLLIDRMESETASRETLTRDSAAASMLEDITRRAGSIPADSNLGRRLSYEATRYADYIKGKEAEGLADSLAQITARNVNSDTNGRFALAGLFIGAVGLPAGIGTLVYKRATRKHE
jgi:hypothetical protein